MNLPVSILALGRRRIVSQLAAIALAIPLTAAVQVYADNSPISGYEEYYPEERIVIPRSYTYDPVNRRSSLTPEPVWRSMFPSLSERGAVEERTFGVPTESDYERRYWRWWHRRNRR